MNQYTWIYMLNQQYDSLFNYHKFFVNEIPVVK